MRLSSFRPGKRQQLGLLVLACLLAALFAFRDGLATIPNWRARHYLANRQLEASLKWLGISQRVSSRNAEAEFLLGRVARRQGKIDTALEHLQRAQKLGWPVEAIKRETWLAQAQLGRLREVEKHLPDLLTDPQGDQAEISEAYVYGYMAARRFNNALDLLEGWIADLPQDPQPYYLRGMVWQELTHSDKALDDFRRAVEVDPTHYAALTALGEHHAKESAPAKALEYFELAEEAKRGDVASRVGQANCLHMLGRTLDAISLLEGALRDDPANTDALIRLAKIEIEKGEYQTALDRLEPEVKRDPRNTELRYAFATALRGVGRTADAREHFESVVEAKARLSEADQLAEKLLEDPTNLEFRFRAGRIHLQYGSEKEGLIWLLGILDLQPNHSATHKLLADHYQAKSRLDPKFGVVARHHAKMASGNENGVESADSALVE